MRGLTHGTEMQRYPRMPHSPELEKLVLGICLLFPEHIGEMAKILKPSDFYYDRDVHIFLAMSKMWQAGMCIDLSLLCEFMKDDKLVGVVYLSSLLDGVPNSFIKNLNEYCKKLREISLQREIIRSCVRVIDNFDRGGIEEPEEIFARLEKDLNKFFIFMKEGANHGRRIINSGTGLHDAEDKQIDSIQMGCKENNTARKDIKQDTEILEGRN